MRLFQMSKESQSRWDAWWACDVVDRPVLITGCSKNPPDSERVIPDGPNPLIPLQPACHDDARLKNYLRWFDSDTHISRNLKAAAELIPGCENAMMFSTGWSVAYCLPFGIQPDFNEFAAWCEHTSGRTCNDEFIYDFDGLWHKWLIESSRRFVEAGKGLYYISPNMWGNHSGDTLMTLVGSEQILLDCMDIPEAVSRALEAITDAEIIVFKEILAIGKQSGLSGSRAYSGVWSSKTCLSYDCDVSAMISPKMYQEIFLPPLLRAMDIVDHRIYHLDGAAALVHLPTILDIKKLQAIQWVCGAGNEGLYKWYDLYKKIQDAKKSIIVYAEYDEVLEVCKQLKPEGLAISFPSPSEEKMLEMEEKVTKFYAK